MFAESVALHRVAKAALPKEFGLLEFEGHVLNRSRRWAAGGRTLQEMGYGSLGAFTRHVRGRPNALLAIRDDGYLLLLLGYLIMVTRLYELRFAVPAAQRIAIYDGLIGDLESRLPEARGRHSDDIREHLAYLRGLRSEAQQQAVAR